jgi:hypothetical protein
MQGSINTSAKNLASKLLALAPVYKMDLYHTRTQQST